MNPKLYRLKGKTQKLSRYILNAIKEIVLRPYVIKASLSLGYNGKLIQSNWGDDINLLFLREIIAHPIMMYGESSFHQFLKLKNYVTIGSIIGMCSDKNSIIWGAGIISDRTLAIKMPRRILAVRGPRTRRKLLEWGLECPEVYGDPALLIPLYYNPPRKITHKIGLIPSYGKVKSLKVKEAFAGIDGLHFIDIRKSEPYTDFIDEIRSCEIIVSYSLHGLIVAEAYKIPSVWIRMATDDNDDEFKYYDFYESIHKFGQRPLMIDKDLSLQAIIDKAAQWIPGQIDLQPLISSCPFPLRKRIEQ